jgi:hypothetical protein
MKKTTIIRIILLVVLGLSMLLILYPSDTWEKNAKEFYNSFNVISGNTAVIDDLSSFTHFEWDTFYSFGPYTPESEIYEVIGYRWKNINSNISEGMNQIVFLNNGKVVCYIDGYPSKYKVVFKFPGDPGHTENYFRINRTDKLVFKMTVTEDGIRVFEYIK